MQDTFLCAECLEAPQLLHLLSLPRRRADTPETLPRPLRTSPEEDHCREAELHAVRPPLLSPRTSTSAHVNDATARPLPRETGVSVGTQTDSPTPVPGEESMQAGTHQRLSAAAVMEEGPRDPECCATTHESWHHQSVQREVALCTRLDAVESLLAQWQAQYQLLHQRYGILQQQLQAEQHTSRVALEAAQALSDEVTLAQQSRAQRVARDTSPVASLLEVAQELRQTSGQALFPTRSCAVQSECGDLEIIAALRSQLASLQRRQLIVVVDEEARYREILQVDERACCADGIAVSFADGCRYLTDDARLRTRDAQLLHDAMQMYCVHTTVKEPENACRKDMCHAEAHARANLHHLHLASLADIAAGDQQRASARREATLVETIKRLEQEAADALQREKTLRVQLLQALRMPTTTIVTAPSSSRVMGEEIEVDDGNLPVHRRFARAHQEALKAVRAQRRMCA